MNQNNQEILMKLEDLIYGIDTALAKARYVQQDVCEDFFGKYFPYEKAEDRTLVAYGFDRYRFLSLIVEDNLAHMEKELAQVREMLKTASSHSA